MSAIVALLKPILLQFLISDAVKQLVVDLLSAYAVSTETKIDDALVTIVRDSLGVKEA